MINTILTRNICHANEILLNFNSLSQLLIVSISSLVSSLVTSLFLFHFVFPIILLPHHVFLALLPHQPAFLALASLPLCYCFYLWPWNVLPNCSDPVPEWQRLDCGRPPIAHTWRRMVLTGEGYADVPAFSAASSIAFCCPREMVEIGVPNIAFAAA